MGSKTTTAIAAVKQEIRLQEWAAQIDKWDDSAAVVCREWNQRQDILPPSAESA